MTKQECTGAVILSVKNKLINADVVFEQIKKYSYKDIKPNLWYPLEQFQMLVDYYEKHTGPTVLRTIGEGIIPEMVKAKAIPNMKPEDFLRGLNNNYRQANRGDGIGEYNIVKEEPKHFIIRKTTLNNCILEEGIISGGIKAFGGKISKVIQTKCVKKGNPECIFDIKW